MDETRRELDKIVRYVSLLEERSDVALVGVLTDRHLVQTVQITVCQVFDVEDIH